MRFYIAMDKQFKFLVKWNFKASITKFFSVLLMVLLFFSQFLAYDIGGIKIGVIDSGVLLLFFVLCGFKKLKMRFVVFFALTFCASMLLSSIYNMIIGVAGLHSILLCIRLFLIFLIIGSASWVNTKKIFEPRLYVYSVLWGLIIACVIGVVSFYLEIVVSKDQQIMWFDDGSHRIRAGGSVGNTGAFGYQVFLLYSISLLAFLYSIKNKWRLFFIFPMTLSLFCLVISSSRGSLSGILFFTVILLFLVNLKDKKAIILMFFLSLLSASFCSFCFLDTKTLVYTAQRVGFFNKKNSDSAVNMNEKEVRYNESNKNESKIKENHIDSTPSEKNDVVSSFSGNIDYFGSAINEDNSAGIEKETEKKSIAANLSSGRLPAWKNYLLSIKEHVVWGVGYKNSLNYYGVLIDNSFISVFVEGGIGAFLLFLSIWISAFLYSIKIYAAEKLKGAFLIAFIISTAFQGVFLDIYSQWISFPLFIFLIFVVSGDSWKENKI